MDNYQPLRIERPPSFFRRYGSLFAFLGAMALLGFLVQFQWVGYLMILAYIVTTFIKAIPARTAFIIALLSLGMVPVAVVLSNWLVAQNFAAYCFVLLTFGVIVTTIELQREPRVSK